MVQTMTEKLCQHVFESHSTIAINLHLCLNMFYRSKVLKLLLVMKKKHYHKDAFIHVEPGTNLVNFLFNSSVKSYYILGHSKMWGNFINYFAFREINLQTHISMHRKDERRWINNLPSVFQKGRSAMLMDSFVTVKSDCLTICFWTCLTKKKLPREPYFSLSFSLFFYLFQRPFHLQSPFNDKYIVLSYL